MPLKSWPVQLIVMDLAAKVSGVLSLLLLAKGHAAEALYAAVALNVFAVARGVAGGRALEQGLARTWQELTEATCQHDLARLDAREQTEQWASLMEATGHVAHFRSIVCGRGASHALMLVVVAAYTGFVVGWHWVAAGAVAAALFGPAVRWGYGRLAVQRQSAFERFADASAKYAVLVDGALQLRAHGVQARHVGRLADAVQRMAEAEKRSHTLRAWLNVLPLAASLLLLLVPFRSYVVGLSADARGFAELGVLAAAALTALAGLVGVAQSWAQARPGLKTLRGFARATGSSLTGGTERVELGQTPVTVTGLRVRYPGAEVDTPGSVDVAWTDERGVAVVGDNGSGKSTLAHCLMGLIEPSGGSVFFGETPLASVDLRAMRKTIAYVPQRPLVVTDRSVAWHLRQFCHRQLDDEEIERALIDVGLAASVEQARRFRTRTLGSLSGGERKRAHLARACVAEPVFIILDEPEAGLDHHARDWLRTYVQQLSQRARILLIVHDENVIPSGFLRVVCRRTTSVSSPTS